MNPELSDIRDFHAHVYYEPGATEEAAAHLRERVAIEFPRAVLGRWHAQPIGPHSRAMYQIAFPVDLFGELVPWLMLNHAGLSVLLHPGTGDGLRDHTEHAVWLGEKLPLRLEAFAARDAG